MGIHFFFNKHRMSGCVHPPAELLEEFDSTKWNPLQCNICSEQYQEPCILQCYHSFCARCVKNRVEDNNLTCPVCGYVDSSLTLHVLVAWSPV